MGAGTADGVAAGLRAWARGIYPLEAAVELLARVYGGRLLSGSWVEYGPDRDRCWFNVERVGEDAGCLSGGERRLLLVAASLADPDGAPVALGDALSGLDRDALSLVLAAVAHAGGSHEHSGIVVDPAGAFVGEDGVRLASRRLGSLYEWPEPPW
jgi:hypothetical protein